MISACLRKRKKPLHSPCWPTRPGIGVREISPRRLVRRGRLSWARSPMSECLRYLFVLCMMVGLVGCWNQPPSPQTVTMLIESSPTSLDPRIGMDGQSEHIASLIFDSLVRKNAHFNLEPWLATSWETPDPLTYRFHLRNDVHFHNGQLLTSADVKYTLDSIRNGTVITAKAAAFAHVDRVDAPDPATVVIHLKQPDAALLWNLSDGAIGIVPVGSGRDFAFHPIGSGPFKFVSQLQDEYVLLERNDNSWQPRPGIARIRFAVVPDAIT